ncbi:MAG: NifB/NifX family molybdenum-iron cluster-binding protein [Spirochaetales bacterium]|nr:NifB/NifX family molybdenum-iron cluster-binding protein [Spirochaetales bacterium]
MKICITAKNPSQLSEMANDFEKCAYFTFFTERSMGFEAAINDDEKAPAQLLIDKGVNVLITKDISSESLTLLNDANIIVYTATSKLITDALSRFRNGGLTLAQKTDIDSILQRKENRIMKTASSTEGDYISAHPGVKGGK